MHTKASPLNLGMIVSVRGSVVDVRFDGRLPPIYSILHAETEKKIVIEVLAQRDARHVRCIALTPTQGLARGMAVEDTGGPLKTPVGKAVLSRMFDVFGNTIDGEPALTNVEWRSVHRAPPPLAKRSTKSEIFETGIKIIDVLVPLERGGKAGLFGGAGVGKTVQRPAGRVVRARHDGADRLVGRRADAARRGARDVAGRTASGQAPLDAGAADGRASVGLSECLVLGDQGGQGDGGGSER